MLTDAELLAAQPVLLRYATRLTKDREEARELVASTNLRALEKRQLYRDQGKPAAVWLCVMMRSAFVSQIRRNGRSPIIYLAEVPDAPRESQGPWRVLASEVATAIERCAPEVQAIFREAAAGVPHEDISRRLGIPDGTVKSRLCRARVKLAAEFGALR